MEEVCKKFALKAIPGRFFNFAKLPNTANAYNKLFWKVRLSGLSQKRITKKTFKKITSSFPLHPFPFYGQDYEGLENLFRKIPFLVTCHFGNFDDLIHSCF